MRKLVFTLMLGAVVAAGCGDDKKSETPKKSYVIDKNQALKVTRLAMRTAALVGRHAVIPPGSDRSAEILCPLSGVEDAITITPECQPDFAVAGAVSCEISETYECPEATGAITSAVELTATGMSMALEAADYQEGNDATGFIRYNGGLDLTTDDQGVSNYKDTLSFVARAAGDTADTTVNSTSDVTVTTDAGKVLLNGLADLLIEGTVDGQGRIQMTDLDFADCGVSPKGGVINLALVGIERAEIEFGGCGEATLYHIEGGQRVNPETFTADELSYAFAQSMTDIANFANVVTNVAPAATTLEGGTFCAPVIPGVVPLLASSVTKPTGIAPFVPTGVANPLLECLSYPEGATSFVHMVWEDATGTGDFADPTQIKVHFFEAGAFAADVGALGGKNVQIYSKYASALTMGAVTLTSLALDAEGMPTAANLTDFCDPRPPTAGGPLPSSPAFCWSRIAFNESFDHLGLRFTEPANVGKFTGSNGAIAAEDLANPFWFIRFID